MKVLECRELFDGCPGRVEAATEDEVMGQAAAHAREVHGVETIDDATAARIRDAIRTA